MHGEQQCAHEGTETESGAVALARLKRDPEETQQDGAGGLGRDGRARGTRRPAGGPGPGPPSMHDELRLLRVGAKLAHLFLHGRAAGLKRARETAALPLEIVAALADQIGGLALRLVRLVLRLLEPLLSVLAQELARLRAGLGRQQQRGSRAGDGAEEEPAQITRRVSTLFVHHVPPSLSGYFRSLEIKTPVARFKPEPTLVTPRKEARVLT